MLIQNTCQLVGSLSSQLEFDQLFPPETLGYAWKMSVIFNFCKFIQAAISRSYEGDDKQGECERLHF